MTIVQRAEMFLKDDTALRYIVDVTSGQHDHFYCADLDQYEKDLKKTGEEYRCPTKFRPDFYNGTMVLPIRVLYKRLYYFKNNQAYHIIGFLCVDSLSKDTFRPDQEKYNCEIGNAFADEFYIILSKFCHYLGKLKKPNESLQAKQLQLLESCGLGHVSLNDLPNIIARIKSEGGNG